MNSVPVQRNIFILWWFSKYTFKEIFDTDYKHSIKNSRTQTVKPLLGKIGFRFKISKTYVSQMKFMHFTFDSVLSMSISAFVTGEISVTSTVMKFKIIKLFWKRNLSSKNFKIYIIIIIFAFLTFFTNITQNSFDPSKSAK